MALHPCLFTNTPDEHFIIDVLPRAEEVLVVSPCSGHGFKFAPVVGEIVAELVTTGRSRFDLTMFRLDRFWIVPYAPSWCISPAMSTMFQCSATLPSR